MAAGLDGDASIDAGANPSRQPDTIADADTDRYRLPDAYANGHAVTRHTHAIGDTHSVTAFAAGVAVATLAHPALRGWCRASGIARPPPVWASSAVEVKLAALLAPHCVVTTTHLRGFVGHLAPGAAVAAAAEVLMSGRG